jgi:hypothetical protein
MWWAYSSSTTRKGFLSATHPNLFVPNNPNYEGSSLLLFDDHNHPVDAEKLTPAQRERCTWRRCYKLVSLLHTNRAGEYYSLWRAAGHGRQGP